MRYWGHLPGMLRGVSAPSAILALGAVMSKTSCDLRVLMRFNDGTIAVWAIDDITGAARMREELVNCGEAYSEQDAAEDCLPQDAYPAYVRQMFTDTHSASTRRRPD